MATNDVLDRLAATVHVGDALAVLRTLPDASVHAIVTDPPYGLSFMGKDWDSDVPPTAIWAECLRVLKPGGHLLAFAGTRTQHRMATRIEDAGFEIRDLIAWVYGSGFPKSHNGPWGGTALKPALEPITVARKPLAGTVAANVQRHGTGGLNIDACRVETADEIVINDNRDMRGGNYANGRAGEASATRVYADRGATDFAATPGPRGGSPLGRWPANLIHDGSDEVLAAFPDAPGQQGDLNGHSKDRLSKHAYGDMRAARDCDARGDEGSAARFFYCAKASTAERGAGNNHPTVKPVDLMRYLVRLVTPRDGTVLDPFAGSGTTGVACVAEGFDFIGCEIDPDHAAMARKRITAEAPLFVQAKAGAS